MNISTTLDQVTSIAIGGFDGMHIAHQKLFSELDQDHGAILAIETGYATITPKMLRQKHAPHPVVILELDEIRHLDASGFIDKLYEMFPRLEKIVVGYDFRFGKERAFDRKDLQEHFRGTVVIVDEVVQHGISVHSRTIRSFIKAGAIDQANKLLGHNYTFGGKVIKGQGIGKTEMVATINLEVEGFILPKDGVYATLTRINDEEHFHPSVSFLGHRATTDGTFAIESHILEATVGEVHYCEIAFLRYLRDNQSFESIADLKQQILRDIAEAHKEHQKLCL